MNNCQTCKYYEQHEEFHGHGFGACKRRAPVVRTGTQGEHSGFPSTYASGGCGEWEGKPVDPKENVWGDVMQCCHCLEFEPCRMMGENAVCEPCYEDGCLYKVL